MRYWVPVMVGCMMTAANAAGAADPRCKIAVDLVQPRNGVIGSAAVAEAVERDDFGTTAQGVQVIALPLCHADALVRRKRPAGSIPSPLGPIVNLRNTASSLASLASQVSPSASCPTRGCLERWRSEAQARRSNRRYAWLCRQIGRRPAKGRRPKVCE